MTNGGKEAPKSRIEALEETVLQLADKVEELEKNQTSLAKTTVKKSAGLFGGKRERMAIKDTTTGEIYVSKAAVGKALAKEADTVAEDHFAWYKLMAKFPDRFVDATPAEKAKVEKEDAERVAKEVEESNIRLAKEEAAKGKK